ncbi:hypothetical protein FRC02_002592 [Tulasnella sp. 418]|nr:hypothetical protein FRC02_002592 [Tulasnella sp. 418]
MSSHSKFAALLDAADSESTIAEKLKGMKFGISKRTWQVAAYGEDEHAYGFGEVSSPDFVASPASHGKEKQYFNDPYGTEGNFDESRSSLLSDSSSTVTASHRESTYGKGLLPSR